MNYEWAYRIGSLSFSKSELLNTYFLNQANPITYSFLSCLPLNLFGDHFASYRILSIIGGTLLLIILMGQKKPFLILIVGLNPLVWIYTGRAYSEMFSVGLMILALETKRNFVLKGFLGIFSTIIKYNSFLVCEIFWALKWFFNTKKINFKLWNDINIKSGTICFLGLLIFFWIYYNEFGIWIIPDHFKTSLHINSLNLINNFFSYGFYLSAMFF